MDTIIGSATKSGRVKRSEAARDGYVRSRGGVGSSRRHCNVVKRWPSLRGVMKIDR
jgi:hypothetical protein